MREMLEKMYLIHMEIGREREKKKSRFIERDRLMEMAYILMGILFLTKKKPNLIYLYIY